MDLSGAISRVTLFPAPRLTGLQMKFMAQGDDTVELNRLLGLASEGIPSLGPFRAMAMLSGDDHRILIDDSRLEAGSADRLALLVHGRVGWLASKDNWSFHDTALQVEAHSDDSRALAEAWNYHMPLLGPLSASAVIREAGDRFELADLQMAVGAQQGNTPLVAHGRIGDLRMFHDVAIDVDLAISRQRLATVLGQESPDQFAPLTGALHIRDRNGKVGIQDLVLNSDGEALRIAMDGRYTDFKRPDTMELNARIVARDLALVGDLFGQKWQARSPFVLQATLTHDDNGQTHLNASLTAAEENVDVDLRGDFSRQPPLIKGKLAGRHIAVPDYYERLASERKVEKEAGNRSGTGKPKVVFSRETIDFDRLKNLDLDVDIEVLSFDPAVSKAQSGKLKVTLKDGLLRIHPAVIKYAIGEMDLDLIVDARETPQIRLTASASDVSPWQGVTGQAGGADIDLAADYDIDIDLSVRGRSPHQLASTLNGDIYLAIRHGKIRQSFFNLLFVDIVGWATDRASKDKFAKVTCGVADLTADDGVVTSNAFFIDTRHITITGEGKIDLGREAVDFVFIPKKKSRLIAKAEPVRIRGSLASPRVKALPVKSAALQFGTLIFAPYVFAGMAATDYLGGKLGSQKDDAPCLLYERRHKTQAAKDTPPGKE